jgi:hypothetical protein
MNSYEKILGEFRKFFGDDTLSAVMDRKVDKIDLNSIIGVKANKIDLSSCFTCM